MRIPRDANAMHILSFPIFLTNDEDKIIWSKSRDGAFSMKSLYYHIMENVMDNSCYAESGDWMTLWNLIFISRQTNQVVAQELAGVSRLYTR
ncbi:hypothetical protein HKD37_07G019837 [Glycine soja]